jgi:predicted transcriptional regulator
MADGDITLRLDGPTAERLREAARLAGADPADWAERALAEALDDSHWRISRERLAAFDQGSGETVSVDDYFAQLRQRLSDALSAR